MDSYVINENGEKVLPGSRRPDGTVRKERRIRAGYVPQDEQPVYQPEGMMARRSVPKCPGLDPAEAAAASASAKSKAAKKNEKRKAKKAEGGAGGAAQQQQPGSSTSQPAAAAAAAAAAAPQQAAAAAASSSAGDGGGGAAAGLDKQIKALSKKVRQCQSLLERQAAGEALSQQEAEKVAKMPAWQEEIRDLEHQLAKLAV